MNKITVDLTEEELGLTCRALSDSMNYKPGVCKDEKWSLLLKLKEIQVRNEDERTSVENIASRDVESSSEKEKHTFKEIVQAVFRGIGFLIVGFLAYNFALVFASVVGYGMFLCSDALFIKLLNYTEFEAPIRNLFGWACAHPVLSITVLAILYLVGFCWFIYKWVSSIVESEIGLKNSLNNKS